jgi:hypothetical protein
MFSMNSANDLSPTDLRIGLFRRMGNRFTPVALQSATHLKVRRKSERDGFREILAHATLIDYIQA